MKNCIDFLNDFLIHFGSILTAFLKQVRIQNHAKIEKGDLLKMSASPARGAHFHRFRTPKSIQKLMKNRSKIELFF